MSRMNAAWSNEPPWAEAVPAIFKEPMTIAFGGAILAHAIFFLGLPVVAGTEKQPDVQPVATTVLTDKEKSEVPMEQAQSQFSTGSLLPNNSGLVMPPLTPGSTMPGSTTTPSTTSGSNFSFGQPSEPSFSSGGYSTGSNNSSSSDFNTQLAEIARKQEEARKEQIKKTDIAKKDAEKVADQKSADKPPAPLPAVPLNMMPPGTPTGEQPKSPTNQSPTNQQPANQPQKQPTRLSDKTIIDADPQRYAFVPDRTGPNLGATRLPQEVSNWYTRDPKTQEVYNTYPGMQLESFPVDTETRTIPYPKEVNKQPVAVIPGYGEKVKSGAAKERLNTYGTAIVGIAIDKQGKFLIEPSIIQSTGHKVLDDYAIEYAKSRIFRVTGQDKFYYMVIPIDPPINRPTA